MKNKAKDVVITAMMASLICVATMIIKIPTSFGYINLGDCFVLLAGWALSPLYGFCAAAIGSALADVFSGYAMYAPVTFIVKGIMALIAFYGVKLLTTKKCNELVSLITCGATAEILMILGYFVFEGILYGFIASAANIPFNAIQGIVGLILGILLFKIFKKNNFFTTKE
ncbi:MAG: ECF transporter S component [Clostridia bacterium]|nr:ECF transporter S component [Clostridia bacterium]